MNSIQRLGIFFSILVIATLSFGAEDGCITLTRSDSGSSGAVSCIDRDGDGYGENCSLGLDCDDTDVSVNSDATEICDDGIDNDCDTHIDISDSDCPSCIDNDGDGYGNSCTAGTDCNDADEFINPGVAEVCNDGVDNDCDYLTDLDDVDCPAPCTDADSDGYGEGCGGPPDCDDTDAQVYPGANEVPDDDIDQDCDGSDTSASDPTPSKIYVALTGDDTNPGTPTEPVLTISRGTELAGAVGGEVLVAAGTYNECVTSVVSLYGGYESSGWTRDIAANATVIAPTDNCDNPSWEGVVSILPGETATLDGFTIDASGITVSLYPYYGLNGVSAFGCAVTAVISNNTIIAEGTGVYLGWGAHIRISNNEIYTGTVGYENYGVFSYANELELYHNVIHGGEGTQAAYGVYFDATTQNDCDWSWDYVDIGLVADGNEINAGTGEYYATGIFFRGHYGATLPILDMYIPPASGMFTNNIIKGGVSVFGSIGFESSFGAATLINNYIYGGSGTNDSGLGIRENAIGVWIEDYALLINNIIDGGYSASSYSFAQSSGIVLASDGEVRLYGNDIWGIDQSRMIRINPEDTDINDIAVVNACSWTGCTEASGNISSDPQLVNPTGGDYHLNSGSVCIDAGADHSLYYGGTLVDYDFEGDARPQQTAPDIGPDEYVP